MAVPEQEAIDPYDLIEAVEILSKLPKDFYENLVSFAVNCHKINIFVGESDSPFLGELSLDK